MIDQTDLYLILRVSTFVAGLLAGSLGGVGSDVHYTCPLLEAGQLAFSSTQFFIDNADTLVDKFGGLGRYLVLVVISFLVMEFY